MIVVQNLERRMEGRRSRDKIGGVVLEKKTSRENCPNLSLKWRELGRDMETVMDVSVDRRIFFFFFFF